MDITSDFGSLIPGSNPGRRTMNTERMPLNEKFPLDEFNDLGSKLSLPALEMDIFNAVVSNYLTPKEQGRMGENLITDPERYKKFLLSRLVEKAHEGNRKAEILLAGLIKHTFLKSSGEDKFIKAPGGGILFLSENNEVVALKGELLGPMYPHHEEITKSDGGEYYVIVDYKTGEIITGARRGLGLLREKMPDTVALAPGDIGYEETERLKELEKEVLKDRE